MRISMIGRATYVVRLDSLAAAQIRSLAGWMVTKTTALPTLVVIDSFDRRVSSDFVMYERNEDEVDAVLKEIIASLNTYLSTEFLFFVRFISGANREGTV
mmetsp:Transcript_17259/g.20792  ORF Transcript_17259/g.20792 Transcript_17259/m.20792 type:complete len:100 (-) Transcript_17259:140-439(-)